MCIQSNLVLSKFHANNNWQENSQKSLQINSSIWISVIQINQIFLLAQTNHYFNWFIHENDLFQIHRMKKLNAFHKKICQTTLTFRLSINEQCFCVHWYFEKSPSWWMFLWRYAWNCQDTGMGNLNFLVLNCADFSSPVVYKQWFMNFTTCTLYIYLWVIWHAIWQISVIFTLLCLCNKSYCYLKK